MNLSLLSKLDKTLLDSDRDNKKLTKQAINRIGFKKLNLLCH